MIVFDDVRDIDFWGAVEFVLPDNKKSSRIMITSRNRDVAEFCTRFAPVHVHHLDPLSFDDALTLFHRKAFPFDPQSCPLELIGLSQDFVQKCYGVPLAIEAIAGLLSTKRKNVSEWKKVHGSLHSRMASDLHLKGYNEVLLESYRDLPYHLKLCLLYFSVFPEDYLISCGRLTRLWIAEGFVKEKVNEDQTLEELAREYLDELLRRNLVKVLEVYLDGRARTCQVHDLMHNFFVKKCEEMSFCQVKKNEEFEFYEWTRRLSIHGHANNNNITRKDRANYGRVRCCFVFNFQEKLPKPIAKLSSFKLLIVLDFKGAALYYLPKAVENLLLLKYLGLRTTFIKIIPKFIGKLQNLETLELRETFVSELPVEINKLVKLRFLVGNDMKLKEGIGALRGLQKLSRVDVSDGEGVINELKNLKQIRRLGIAKLREQQGKLLCKLIESMNHLCSLWVKAYRDEAIDLQSLDDPPQYLQRLVLGGRLERIPEWIPRLQNLVKLQFLYSSLKEDPLSFLQDLPELLELQFFNAYKGEELHFKSGSFKKLKVLELTWMDDLRTLKVHKGALPVLEDMKLMLCLNLEEVPTDIHILETLKHFHLSYMPKKFIESMRRNEGQGYDKIKAVTHVTDEWGTRDLEL